MAGPTEIRTERLLLRPFRLSDIDDVLDYGSDPEWAEFFDPYDRPFTENTVAGAVLTSWDEHPCFAMELDGRVVGMVELSRRSPIAADLSYEVAKPHWGKGLAPEAARAVVDWGFREMGLRKVDSYAATRNRRSWRVMEKIGMTREGLIRRELGRDSVSYGVLREEWAATEGPLPPAPPRPERAQRPDLPVLRTERLLLRRFGPRDVDDVFAYASDPVWAEHLVTPVPRPYTRRNAEEFIARRMRAPVEREPSWAIVLEGLVVGGIGIDVDPGSETGDLHYGLSREYWGRGITLEASRAVVDWALAKRRLAKISARADLRNRRSWRVLEKLGMTREGVRRSQARGASSDQRRDIVYYGLLPEEWAQSSAGPS